MTPILASAAGLVTIAAFASVLGAIANTKHVQRAVTKVSAKTKLPKAITMFVFVAEFAELGKTIQHVSVMSIIISAMAFTIIMAARSGEGEVGS